MGTTAPPVLVAVGPRGSSSAIEYAAVEALRQRRGLHLVHAVHPLPTGAVTDDAVAVIEREGAEILASAVERASAMVLGGVPVSSALPSAPPIPAVVAASAGAPLVVVGRCSEGRPTHPYVRSVTGGLAARVHSPVVSVPDGWTDRTGSSHVVVGLDDPAGGDTGVLLEAFAAARARRGRLSVVSTWWLPPGAGRHTLTQVDGDAREEAIRAGIDSALADLVVAYADVSVDVHVHDARPGEALVEASQRAGLVVLGRHDHLLSTGSYLGPVARSVLRESACPVLLARPHPAHRVRHRDRSAAQLA